MPADLVIVLFGATGDLAKRKLLPGMFHLARVGLMPQRFRIIGTARTASTSSEFRAAGARLGRRLQPPRGRRGELGPLRRVAALRRRRRRLRRARGGDRRRPRGTGRRRGGLLFYLSLPPRAAAGTVEAIGERGLGDGARVITEKPFGTDLASARELNAGLHAVFAEQRHLPDRPLPRARGGAEPAGAALRQRHVRADLEPQPHRPRPDRHPGDALDRDAGQLLRGNRRLPRHDRHPPVPGARLRRDGAADSNSEPKPLGLEREKVFDSMPPLRPEDVVRGQYAGYREEEGVAADSDTETFVAVRAFVDNWRWEGVPFYLRSGKRMAESKHVLTIAFKQPPRRMFPLDCRPDRRGLRPRPPHLRARRPRQHLRLLPGQGAGAEDRARRGPHAVQLRRQLRRRRAGARPLRAADPRRDARRPHPLHQLRRDRAPLGDLRAGARRTRRRSSSTSRAPGARSAPAA